MADGVVKLLYTVTEYNHEEGCGEVIFVVDDFDVAMERYVSKLRDEDNPFSYYLDVWKNGEKIKRYGE